MRTAPTVQVRPLRALVAALLTMDLRSQVYGQTTGAKPTEASSPVYWVIGQFLATSALLSLALLARVDAGFFALANLTVSAVLLFAALVVEFHEVVLDPADAEVLGHRPVTRATYAAARLLNLLAYVALMTVATAIFPSIIGCALPDSSLAFAPAYLLAAVLTALGTTALVVLLYTSLGAGAVFDQARGLLSWVQVGSIMVLFYGGQLMLRNADGGVEYFAARPPAWLDLLPTAPFARAVAALSAAGAPPSWPWLGLAIALCLGLVALATWRLAAAWGQVHAGPAHVDAAVVTGGQVAQWSWLTGSRPEAASFWLTRTMLRRDQELKLRVWPALAMPLAALVLGASTGQLESPLVSDGSHVALSLAVPVLLAAAVPSLVQNLLFSRDPQASWLLALAPVEGRADLARGARKALLLSVLAPATLLVLAIEAWLWRAPLDALLVALSTWLMIELSARLAQVMVLTRLPFSIALTRGATLGSIALVSTLASAGATGVAALQFALAGSATGQWAVAGALALASWPAGRWADREAARPSRNVRG